LLQRALHPDIHWECAIETVGKQQHAIGNLPADAAQGDQFGAGGGVIQVPDFFEIEAAAGDLPGGLQQAFELIYEFVHGQAEDQIGHDGRRYMGYFGTIFLFILTANLIGIVPCFESPTQNPSVTAGCALTTFIYYNLVGIQAQGFKYPLHFAGPVWWLAPLMLPIEIISHMARCLSLTVRLYANMFAGEQVTMVFLKLTFFLVPVIFMGLHVFVGLIQAYIFMLLTMVYVGGAVAHEH